MTANPPIKIYIQKTGTRITFKIKTWYYFEHLIMEVMKLYICFICSQYIIWSVISYFIKKLIFKGVQFRDFIY